MKKKLLIMGSICLLIASVLVTAQEVPVISLMADGGDFTEGQRMTWTFKSTAPTPAEGLAVTVQLTEDTDPAPGDIKYNVEGGKGVTNFELVKKPDGTIEAARITLAGGITEAVMLADVLADGNAEGPESALWTLVDGDGYKADAAQNTVRFTLHDPK